MILTLEVNAPHAANLGTASRTFRSEGGTIGRDNVSDWVLPHTKVSGRHALISCRNNVFYIEDTSRNGVCINSSKNRLVHGRPYALKSGDRILIEPYEIHVSITREPDDSSHRRFVDLSEAQSREIPSLQSRDVKFGGSDPFGPDDPFGQRRVPLPMSSQPDLSAEAVPGEELDPLKLLDPTPRHAPPRKAPSARNLELGSPWAGHYQPPAVPSTPAPAPQSDQTLIPHDYDPLADDSPAISPPIWPKPGSSAPSSERSAVTERPAPPPISQVSQTPVSQAPASCSPLPPTSPPAASVNLPAAPGAPPEPSQSTPAAATSSDQRSPDLAAVLAGAGMDPASVTPELARSFGQILRVVVAGVMDVLRSRQQIKDEFRMRMTHFRAVDNNPLKFSANVEDALHNLLVKRNAAYLGPVEAFEDAFDDLRNHQIAMLAGMRVAFESMLAEFDPDRLQEQFDRQLKRGLLPGVAKLRYWDLYRDKRHDMVRDPEASFRKLFGEEFARAYEEQLDRLKAESRAGKSSTNR